MIKAFVTNLTRYTEGKLVGEWITFPVDEDEQEQIMLELSDGLNDFEYFITDYEAPFSIGEYTRLEELNELAELVEEIDDDELVAAICELYGKDELENWRGFTLNSEITTDEDLGYWYADNGYINIPSHLELYFDYDAFGRYIRLEADGGFTNYGWLERC